MVPVEPGATAWLATYTVWVLESTATACGLVPTVTVGGVLAAPGRVEGVAGSVVDHRHCGSAARDIGGVDGGIGREPSGDVRHFRYPRAAAAGGLRVAASRGYHRTSLSSWFAV